MHPGSFFFYFFSCLLNHFQIDQCRVTDIRSISFIIFRNIQRIEQIIIARCNSSTLRFRKFHWSVVGLLGKFIILGQSNEEISIILVSLFNNDVIISLIKTLIYYFYV